MKNPSENLKTYNQDVVKALVKKKKLEGEEEQEDARELHESDSTVIKINYVKIAFLML